MFECAGCNNQEMMLVPRNKFRIEEEVAHRLKEDKDRGEEIGAIDVLLVESVFHRKTQPGDDALINKNVYIDLGDNFVEAVQKEFWERFKEGEENSLSHHKAEKLRNVVDEKEVSATDKAGQRRASQNHIKIDND